MINRLNTKSWLMLMTLISVLTFSCKKEEDPLPKNDPSKKNQTITFSQEDVEFKNDLVIELNGKSNSELDVSYKLVTGEGSIAGNKLTVKKAGDFKVKAEQTGDDKFNAASPVEVTFKVIGQFGGGVFSPTIGGPREPNQVYVSLRMNKETTAKRVDWDLAFYNGSENRVRVNFSTYMMAKKIDATDLTKVTAQDTVGLKKTVNIGLPNSDKFIDNPDGDLSKTAMGDITSTGAVYLINRGYLPKKVGGREEKSVAIGWKKVKVSKTANGYKLEYADIASTEIKSAEITKDANYNFTYFSFNTDNTVKVEPEKGNWDLCFSVSSNIYKSGKVSYSYGYSDYVLTNRYGGIKTATIKTKDKEGKDIAGTKSYDAFTLADAQALELSNKANGIGSSWRSVFKKIATPNIYYILKDTNGNYYKLEFLALVNDKKERGYSAFKFDLLK